MEKIWIVAYVDYDEYEVEAVFSDQTAACDYSTKKNKYLDETRERAGHYIIDGPYEVRD